MQKCKQLKIKTEFFNLKFETTYAILRGQPSTAIQTFQTTKKANMPLCNQQVFNLKSGVGYRRLSICQIGSDTVGFSVNYFHAAGKSNPLKQNKALSRLLLRRLKHWQ